MHARLKRENLKYEFSRSYEPVLRIDPGTQVVIETEDAFNGRFQSPQDIQRLIGPGALPPNPLNGPIYIHDSRPGDALAVHIEAIELGQRGGACFAPSGLDIDPWFPEAFGTVFPIEAGNVALWPDLWVPAQPFIGCLGTAPAHSSPQSLLAFASGGNMDCPLLAPGSCLFLPVNVEGAFLYAGDVHALQGDGEFCGTAVETRSETTLRIELLQRLGAGLNWPRVETPDSLAVIVGGLPMADGFRLAFYELLNWVVQDYGTNREQTFLALSQVAHARFCSRSTIMYVVSKSFLKAARAK